MRSVEEEGLVAGSTPPPSGRRRWGRNATLIAAAIAVVALVVVVLAVILGGLSAPMSDPKFASLATTPDRSLQGTVAYYADASGCVRIVAAAGQPSKDVLCPASPDQSSAATEGKQIGPSLAWLPNGRLEVTMFRFADQKGEKLTGAWQKIVDVRTGKVEEVPAAQLPTAPEPLNRPTVSPSGERVATTSSDGRVEVTLTDSTGTRSLLKVQGSVYYTLQPAFWAPNWQWIVGDDGRILVITRGTPSSTRVLTDESRIGTGDDRLARFAVTGTNFLTSTG